VLHFTHKEIKVSLVYVIVILAITQMLFIWFEPSYLQWSDKYLGSIFSTIANVLSISQISSNVTYKLVIYITFNLISLISISYVALTLMFPKKKKNVTSRIAS